MRSGPVRVPPLPAEEWDDDVAKALGAMVAEDRRNPEGAGTALATLARHPHLAKSFLRFNVHLLFTSTLPPRLRELVILRVAHRAECVYEWFHHVEMGREEGLTDEEIAAVQRGVTGGALDQALLTAADELFDDKRLTDETWAALSTHLDERQRMDLVFTVGCYTALAMAFNTFGVELEEDFAADIKKER